MLVFFFILRNLAVLFSMVSIDWLIVAWEFFDCRYYASMLDFVLVVARNRIYFSEENKASMW